MIIMTHPQTHPPIPSCWRERLKASTVQTAQHESKSHPALITFPLTLRLTGHTLYLPFFEDILLEQNFLFERRVTLTLEPGKGGSIRADIPDENGGPEENTNLCYNLGTLLLELPELESLISGETVHFSFR